MDENEQEKMINDFKNRNVNVSRIRRDYSQDKFKM